jgi:hypothetical protein
VRTVRRPTRECVRPVGSNRFNPDGSHRPQVFGTSGPVKHTDLLRLIQPHIAKSAPAAAGGSQGHAQELH